ncbi:MAG TPA: hypothetical protein VN515_00800, partial [Terriglobales bacterium]|nr:hypothetical protein [Terriglobales bacterium]
ATSELQTLQSIQPTHILPRARERWHNVVARLTDTRDLPAARDALRELIGDRVTIKNENGDLFAEIAASECQIKLVAGARCGLYLTEPLRVPLSRSESEDSKAKRRP